jgi:transcription factor IIIB subunit 2
MTALANQLMIQEAIVNSGVQIFKLAAVANFIQGRRMDMVAACCLYSACRKEKPCRVMLIDFADKVQVRKMTPMFYLLWPLYEWTLTYPR